jgi:3-deoxy-D-manno-octulosonate 8-phosphate phosphatase (KDO 8-P phosphatase)
MIFDQFPKLNTIHTIVFDFDGVFTNNKVYINGMGEEFVVCDRSDGLACDLMRYYLKIGLLNAEIFILSKESNSVVAARAKKLQIECKQNIGNKYDYLKNYLNSRFSNNLDSFGGVVYLGNDLNDIPAMKKVGFSVAPSDAHPLVRNIASVVLPEKGGDGFIRSFVEHLFNIHTLTSEEIDDIISNC